MNHCKIVEDLLPLYLDHLTSEETSEYIRKHMENCSMCMQNYKRMYAEYHSTEEVFIPNLLLQMEKIGLK